jgi:ABC-type Mn2+/Zn2+ transport system permease subunit
MKEFFREVFDPEFLLRNSLYTSILIGAGCPLVGVYLVLRRLVFMGVALPQISSCGIAFAFALHTWGWIPHAEESEQGLAFFGASIFTLIAIAALSVLERRGRGMSEGRIGTIYVLAGAWSILLLMKNPYGEHGLLERLRGEIIAVANADLLMTGIAFLFIAIMLFVFQKEFLLVSFDADLALALKKNVLFWDAFLFLLIGIAVSLSVLSVGPLVTFGFLVIPPLIAHLFARTMRQLALLASIIGAVSGFAGFCIAYRGDYPVGPTDVALLGVVYLLAWLAKRIVHALAK